MKRASTLLVSLLLAASTLSAPLPAAAAAAHVWSNSDAFKMLCLGVNDTYPQQEYNLTVPQLTRLGFSPVGGALGPGFTRTAFLANVLNDYAVFVHSHGDNYWAASGAPNIDSAFLQDPGTGKCNGAADKVRSSSIKATTQGSFYNIVIMSTCMLGSSSSTMPGAFQIEKTKSASDYEFYLSYVNHTWDSASFRFEKAFWSYMDGGALHARTLAQAFTYAASIGGYEPVDDEVFQANWWGNPYYDGTPQRPEWR
jgi:hypothetical protein